VAIIGGGIGGCSIAYHLAKAGDSDVALLERRQHTCGATWHAAGAVGTLWPTKNMTQLGKYSHDLYQSLEAETGQATGYKRNGSITVATNRDRMKELTRAADLARVFGVKVDVVGPGELAELYPGLNNADIVGGLHIPEDGQTNPIDTTMALAKGARMNGARILEETKATRILVENGRAVGVETDKGAIGARKVVLAGGMWSRDLAAEAGVVLPLYACEHYYVVTEEIPGLPSDLPIMRDLDNGVYFKEDAGKLLFGFFEDNAIPLPMSKVPEDFCFDELPCDFEHFERYLERAMGRVPALETAGIRTFFCGPESFTTDNQHLMGEAPGLENLYVACGFNSRGLGGGGGIGKVMAEWIIQGYPPMDLWESDARRVMPFQGDEAYLKERAAEALERSYAMHWPYFQYTTSRGVRKSALHDELAARHACFGEVAGWERPNWYAPEGVEPVYEYSYDRQNWFPYAAEEHRAVREAVGLYDLSSLAKIRVTGADAEGVLQLICSNDVAVEPGRTVYTQWLNVRGGIEADLTVARLGEAEFLISTACSSQVKDWTWLHRNLPDGSRVEIADVTDELAALSLQGPRSRDVLAAVCGEDLSAGGFPFGSGRWLEISERRVWGQRISYVGELGWEIFARRDDAITVFGALEAAGLPLGLRLIGMHTVDSLRLEKAFRHWGHDITYEDTPVQAGLTFACRFDKKTPFLGHDAVLRQKEAGIPTKRLVQFLLEEPEPLLFHNEPILRDNQVVGYLTSGNYAHHLGAAIGMGFVGDEAGIDASYVASGRFEIEVAGERVPARAGLKPFYDPSSSRMRS
jgi:4-methylaminobutanoate oxidase (formaldehyde-forming)